VLIVGQTPIQEIASVTSVRVLFLAEGTSPPEGAQHHCKRLHALLSPLHALCQSHACMCGRRARWRNCGCE
jgi:hypothetical protein